jgi:hypothetical protein
LFGYLFVCYLFVCYLFGHICLLVCYVRMTIWCKLGALFVNFLWQVEPENRDVQRSRSGPLMSALGQKRASEHVQSMSALPPKADMDQHGRDVRFVPKANMPPGIRLSATTYAVVSLVAYSSGRKTLP